MRKNFVFLLLICFASPWAEAGYYVSFIASRLNLEYRNIKTSGVVSDTQGNIELIGLGGGFNSMTAGNFGYEVGGAVIGTNNEKLNPNPAWGVPYYLRGIGAANYLFSFGLFFKGGVDFISTTSQEVENHYLGLGVLYGLGYRINDRMNFALTTTNNSVLFAGDNNRYLRGQIFEFNWTF